MDKDACSAAAAHPAGYFMHRSSTYRSGPTRVPDRGPFVSAAAP